MSLYLTYPQLADESRPTIGKFKCFHCEKRHPIGVKMYWGEHLVCPKCEKYLFMEDEMRNKIW